MATAKDILKIAQAEIGVKESPANSNNVKYNTWYYGKVVNGSAYPWCAAFVSWVFSQVDPSLIKKSVSCMEIGNWFKKNGQWKTSNPQVGDVVFFKYDRNSRWTNHVGIIEKVNADGSIVTIEGNTSVTSDDNGGSVMRRTRKTNIVGYGTPKYNADINTTPTSSNLKGIDVSGYNKITDYQAVKNDGVQFAILKIIRKDLNLDKLFETHLNGFNKVGLPVIAVYNYSYATTVAKAKMDAAKVVKYLMKHNMPTSTTVYMDVEDKCQQGLGQLLIDMINAYQEVIEGAGYRFGLYTGLSFYKSYIKPYKSSLKCTIEWIARYKKGYTPMPFAENPEESSKPDIGTPIEGYQYTSSGVVNGIQGNVDLNILYNTTPLPSSTSLVKNVVRVNTILNVRNAPNGTKVGSLTNGTEVDILDYKNGWFKIGADRWISATYVSNTIGTVTASVLNIRSGAGTSHTDIGDLKNNEKVRILQELNGWYMVLAGTKFGWVSGKYIKIN